MSRGTNDFQKPYCPIFESEIYGDMEVFPSNTRTNGLNAQRCVKERGTFLTWHQSPQPGQVGRNSRESESSST